MIDDSFSGRNALLLSILRVWYPYNWKRMCNALILSVCD